MLKYYFYRYYYFALRFRENTVINDLCLYICFYLFSIDFDAKQSEKLIFPKRNKIFLIGKTYFLIGKTIFLIGKTYFPIRKTYFPIRKTYFPIGKTHF